MRKLLLAAIIIFAGFWVAAQNISVSSFERRDNDMDARVNYPVKDQNGEVCALIKVETTQTGFVFEGGSLGIMKTERKTGEYWIYLPWGSKRITIKHDQLGILRDYTFPESIEKSTVYLMKLTTGKVTVVVEEPEILTQWVVITSTPDGAQVYVDDKPVGNTPFSREYSLGQHNYRVELPMYHPEAGLFTLDGVADKVRITASLKPNFGSISVSSSPESGADVLLDGNPTGQKTPCTLEKIRSGSHRITIKKTMYYDAWQEVTVEDSKTTTAALTMNPAYGELDITTNPAADIFIDDVKVGSGSYSVRKSSGFYTVEARKEKHSPDSKKVEVTDGQTVPVALAPVPQYGILKISSTPPDAEIYIDGVKKGTTPTTIRQLLVGDYNIELRMQGYASYSAKTTIKQNETTEISETMHNGMQVTISSTPTGAALEIDGTSAGSTPYSGNLSFGNHTLKLTNNTKVLNENISVAQGGKTSWSFDVSENTNSFTDSRDGTTYKTVKIGSQTWMAENLDYSTGNSWCYDDNSSNCDVYGRLYDWQTAEKACPTGWHLPSDAEWTQLCDYLGGFDIAGGKLKETGTTHWQSPNTEASNSFGFAALPGGYRNGFINFLYLGNYGLWWSSTEPNVSYAWDFVMGYNYSYVGEGDNSKEMGFSVRCVKD